MTTTARCLSILLLLISPLTLHSEEPFDPYQGPRPLVVWIQTNPWAMVIAADTPRLAIYEDGSVIRLELRKNTRAAYRSARLSTSQLDEILARIRSFGDLSAVESTYNLAPGVTDLPRTLLYLDVGDSVTRTEIYGLGAGSTEPPGYTVAESGLEPDELPEGIVSLHAYLQSLTFQDEREWVPTYIEVMIWPYEYAPQRSIHWPSGWPGLDSPRSFQRGDSYSIFLSGNNLRELRRLLKSRKPKGAMEIGGRKWAVSYRYAFPGRPVWAQALRQ